MISVDTNILLYALNVDAAEHLSANRFLEEHGEDESFVLCELVHNPDIMDNVWAAATDSGFARTRIFDARLAHTLVRHGVTRFATRNVKHFKGFGLASVWDPIE